jgi:hypothetical protein
LKVSFWKLSPFSKERSPMFSGKNPNISAENEVSMTCYTPQHCMMKLAPAKFPVTFRFSLPRKFLQTFSKAFQAICGPKKIPSSIFA